MNVNFFSLFFAFFCEHEIQNQNTNQNENQIQNQKTNQNENKTKNENKNKIEQQTRECKHKKEKTLRAKSGLKSNRKQKSKSRRK